MPNNVPRLVQTEDRRYVRDTENMALLTTDRSALLRHRTLRAKSAKAVTLEQEVTDLKEQVRELSRLVQHLLNQNTFLR